MARLVIRGRRKIEGTHRPPGNKNAALPMLAASLLTDQPVTLSNVPAIDDVRTMLEILEHLGAAISMRGHTVTICAASLRTTRLPEPLCRRVRSSILFAGPLCARHGGAHLYPPGGDVIGRRRVDTHFAALSALGIRVALSDGYRFRAPALRGADLLLDEASVTATENALMAAVLAPGITTLFNAACEPHVQDLCRLLQRMGARLSGVGTNRLVIRGVSSLRGARHAIAPDPIDIASYAVAAAVTGGRLEIRADDPASLRVIERSLQRVGLRWQTGGGRVLVPAGQRLRIHNDLGAAIPKVEDGPWPSFPSDLMSIAIVLATQARGTVLFFEKMFESRMVFVDRLIAMGARIVQCDPHRVIVSGPARLHGTHLSSPDIRAGIAMVLAALCARGTSTIDNAQSIDRGYQRVDEELRRLGADIERVD